ncbi:MAG: DUF493 family protein [Syntrophobacterales bacterium]|jgi:uncharacterized protein YbbK (DUF523 family)/putative lipoic acid-binding regulatory protein|nr:DUF493 family protein [Syntrophobacterales bacterium]
MKKAKIGISACLLGFPVRYNGKHKLDSPLLAALEPHADFFSVCPETECGLSVPREEARLFGNPRYPKMITVETRCDLTRQMIDWADRKVRELREEKLSGFIFKGGSPSCGLKLVRVFDHQGEEAGYGTGLFAQAFVRQFPDVPVEEELPLRDFRLRDDFIKRVLLFHDRQCRPPAMGQITAQHHTFRELLDRNHTWPCLFPFKFIAPMEKLHDILLLFPEEEPALRSSKEGKYVSVTIRKHVRSSDEVVACYNRLEGIKGVICL